MFLFPDQSLLLATTYQHFDSTGVHGVHDGEQPGIQSPQLNYHLCESPEMKEWALERLEFDEFLVSPSAPAATVLEPLSSPPSLSSDTSASPPSSPSDNLVEPSDCSVPSPSWTYDSFRDGVLYDPSLVEALDSVTSGIVNEQWPTREQALKFVLQGPKNYLCAVDTCAWHTRGWKRDDRGIAHVLKEHFRILHFPCPNWYVFTQDSPSISHIFPAIVSTDGHMTWSSIAFSNIPALGINRRLNMFAPSLSGTSCWYLRLHSSSCSICSNQSFDKLYNLTRHRRNVHRRSAGGRRAAKARR